MKSAEEWTDTDLNRAIFAHGEEVYKVVKARDLEMWKQGMTDAAEMADAASATSCKDFRQLSGRITLKRDIIQSV